MFLHTILVRNYFERNGNFNNINEQSWFQYNTNRDEQCYKDIGIETNNLKIEQMELFDSVSIDNKLISKFKPLETFVKSNDDIVILKMLVTYFTTCTDTYLQYDTGTKSLYGTDIKSVKDIVREVAVLSVKDFNKFISYYLNSEFKLQNIKSDKNIIKHNKFYTKKAYSIKDWDSLIKSALSFIYQLYKLIPKKYRDKTPILAYLSLFDKSLYSDLLELSMKYFGSYEKLVNLFGVNIPDLSLSYTKYGIIIYNLFDKFIVIKEDTANNDYILVNSIEELLYCIPSKFIPNTKYLVGGIQ